MSKKKIITENVLVITLDTNTNDVKVDFNHGSIPKQLVFIIMQALIDREKNSNKTVN